MGNNLSVSKSYQNKGDLVSICEVKNNCDELKDHVASADKSIAKVSQRISPITIVGLQQEYSKDEHMQMLKLQNGFMKGFFNSDDLKEHI